MYMPELKHFIIKYGKVEARIKFNEWYREYRKKNLRKSQKYGKKYMKEWRKTHKDLSAKKWQKKNAHKFKVECILNKAIIKGIIKRLPCQICGKKKSVAHHTDYRKPLEVVFLCYSHHREYHYAGKRKPIK